MISGPASSHLRLEEVAKAVSPLSNRIVFHGTATIPLLVEQSVGRTEDSAAPITAISYSSRDRLRPELRQMGLEPETNRGAAECWRTAAGLSIEITVHEDDDTNYANPWYAYSLDCTTVARITPALSIRIAGAPAFLAAAWWNASQFAVQSGTPGELGDVITLIHGRPEIVAEVAAAPRDVRSYLNTVAGQLLARLDADLIVDDALPRAARLRGAVDRILKRIQLLRGAA